MTVQNRKIIQNLKEIFKNILIVKIKDQLIKQFWKNINKSRDLTMINSQVSNHMDTLNKHKDQIEIKVFNNTLKIYYQMKMNNIKQ